MGGIARVIGLLLTFLPTVAWAQGSPSAAERKQARSHFEQGQSFYDVGAYDDALREYQAAYKIVPAPQLLFNIAQCYRLKGDKPNAIDYYQRFLEKVPHDPVSDEARDYIAKLKVQIQLEVAEAERKRAEQEAAESKRRAAEEAELRKRTTHSEEEVVKNARAKLDEEQQRKNAESEVLYQKRLSDAQHFGRTTRITGIALAGVGIALAIVSYFEIQKGSDAADQIRAFNNSESAPWTPALAQAELDKDGHTGVILAGISIGTLAAATVVYFWGVHQRTNAVEDARFSRSMSLVPELGPHAAGLRLGWTF